MQEVRVTSLAEVDLLVAEHLLGWRWLKFTSPTSGVLCTGIFPPDAPDRVFPNGWAERWVPSDATQPRFSNWQTPIWCDAGEWQSGIPEASNDWAFMGTLQKQFTHVEIFRQRDTDSWVVWLFETTDETKPGFRGCQQTAPLTFCDAALRSKGIVIETKPKKEAVTNGV
ncbi:MAG: hypothetical protein RBJ76_13325 [Stenomitos frigidus ULC029]